jgi:hypothetical protein
MTLGGRSELELGVGVMVMEVGVIAGERGALGEMEGLENRKW